MNYTEKDLQDFEARHIKAGDVDRQLDNLNRGFAHVSLAEAAGIGNGIRQIDSEEEEGLTGTYMEYLQEKQVLKMVPASGSATRMFKDLFNFMENYTGSEEEFLDFLQNKDTGSMHYFFTKLDELPFYTHLSAVLWHDGKDIDTMLRKREYNEILKYILCRKGLNYGNTPKGLVDFHIYRDFVRTAFDEHLVEGALYCNGNGVSRLHFTVSEEYLPAFRQRLRKVTKVFEKMFNVKYDVTFSIQKPETDTVSLDADGNILRDADGHIVFRPGGHGALIYNLDELDADLIFIKNIDNIIPDRSKGDTVKYKQLLGGTLIRFQEKIFSYLEALDNDPSDALLEEMEAFTPAAGYRSPEGQPCGNREERISRLRNILNRPLRVCGMVRNEGEPGGGPFWVRSKDGSTRLMIIESAQIDKQDEGQQKIAASATHFNPVDLVCSTRDYKGRKFDLKDFIAADQGFITRKSFQGRDIKVQELPGLWNGAMANWNTIFVEVPLSTFTPVKTVFDLFRFEHRNVLKQ